MKDEIAEKPGESHGVWLAIGCAIAIALGALVMVSPIGWEIMYAIACSAPHSCGMP